MLYIETSDMDKQGGEPIFIDRLEGIAFGENIDAQPIYGIGQPVFGFTNLGNVVVSGQISLRFVHQNYLLNAIKAAKYGTDNGADSRPQRVRNMFFNGSSTTDLSRIQQEELDRAERNEVRADRFGKVSGGSRLFALPYYFNFRLVFNNENQYHQDNSKILVIKDVRILSSQLTSGVSTTGPVNINYNFIARMVK